MAATAGSARVQRDVSLRLFARVPRDIMPATTQEQERYHGCKHAKKRSNDGPLPHQTATRRVTHPKDGAGVAAKERGNCLNTLYSRELPQHSTLITPQHQSLSHPHDTGGRKDTHPTTFRAHMLRLPSDTHAPSSSALRCLTLALLSRFLLCILVVSFLLRHQLPAPRMRGQSVNR